MSEYDKRWKAKKFLDLDFNEEDAERAVLCVNACANMSGEEVKRISTYPSLLLRLDTRIKRLKDECYPLKAQLDEAVELLQEIRPFTKADANRIKALLAKHKENS